MKRLRGLSQGIGDRIKGFFGGLDRPTVSHGNRTNNLSPAQAGWAPTKDAGLDDYLSSKDSDEKASKYEFNPFEDDPELRAALLKSPSKRSKSDLKKVKKMLLKVLNENTFFKKYDDEILEQVALCLWFRAYTPAQPVILQGDPGDAMYIITAGTVKVLVSDAMMQEVVSYTHRSLADSPTDKRRDSPTGSVLPDINSKNGVGKADETKVSTPRKAAGDLHLPSINRKSGASPRGVASESSFNKKQGPSPRGVASESSFNKKQGPSPGGVASESSFNKKQGPSPGGVASESSFNKKQGPSPGGVGSESSCNWRAAGGGQSFDRKRGSAAGRDQDKSDASTTSPGRRSSFDGGSSSGRLNSFDGAASGGRRNSCGFIDPEPPRSDSKRKGKDQVQSGPNHVVYSTHGSKQAARTSNMAASNVHEYDDGFVGSEDTTGRRRGSLRGMKGYEVPGTDVAHLGKGTTFGELALITGAPRKASIVTLQECSFLVLMKEDFERILANIATKSQPEKIEMIKQVEVCEDLERVEVLTLASECMLKHFSTGELLLADNLDKLFLIAHGSLQVCQFKPKLFDDPFAKDLFERKGIPGLKEGVHYETLDTLKKGDYFGEASLLPASRRNLYYKVIAPIECLWLHRELFEECIPQSMRENIVSKTTQRAQEYERRSCWKMDGNRRSKLLF